MKLLSNVPCHDTYFPLNVKYLSAYAPQDFRSTVHFHLNIKKLEISTILCQVSSSGMI